MYDVWGSTYPGITYTVTSLPPFLAMGSRFLMAGLVILSAVLALRGRTAPATDEGACPLEPA